jgi:DNA sulfur modification protein DndB
MVKNGVATYPAIRALMGDWAYYVTTVEFRDVATRVSRADEIHANEKLREWIQRKLTPRAETIAQYLLSQPQRFFNALILGIYGGKPEWFPVDIGNSPTVGKPHTPGWARESIGLLRLHGGEKIFAIDGQHRVEAIKRAIKKNRKLEEEQQCAIFVAHDTSDRGRERTRRLFSTLNRYAKPVSKGEIVALDEDDAFAIVTRRLVEEYPPLRDARVDYGKRRQIPLGDQIAVTSILTLSEVVQTISLPSGATRKMREELTRLRPPQQKLDELYAVQVAFWNALRKEVPEIKEATDAEPSAKAAGRYRTAAGGHLLFRPVAQKAFAAAARVLVDRGKTFNKAVAILSRVPMQLADGPWVHVFWDPIKGKVTQPRKPALAQNLMLHLVGEAPFPAKYELLREYRSAVKSETAILPTPR